MELNVIENKKNKIVFEIKGEDHTFCNALKKELLNDKSVKIASYVIDHPLISFPKMILETDGEETAKSALTNAAKRLVANAEKFKKEIKEIK